MENDCTMNIKGKDIEDKIEMVIADLLKISRTLNPPRANETNNSVANNSDNNTNNEQEKIVNELEDIVEDNAFEFNSDEKKLDVVTEKVIESNTDNQNSISIVMDCDNQVKENQDATLQNGFSKNQLDENTNQLPNISRNERLESNNTNQESEQSEQMPYQESSKINQKIENPDNENDNFDSQENENESLPLYLQTINDTALMIQQYLQSINKIIFHPYMFEENQQENKKISQPIVSICLESLKGKQDSIFESYLGIK